MSPEDFKRLASAGLNIDQIALVMEMMERDAKAVAEAEEARKSKGRERVAKWRLERSRNVTVQLQNVTVPLVGEGARGLDNSLTQKIEPQESKKEQTAQARDLSDFKTELAEIDPDRLNALIKHRRAKRAQNSGHSARLFRRDADLCGMSLAEAADTCISRNWITVKPEYFGAQARGSPKAPSQSDVFKLIGQRAADDHRRETTADSGSARSLIPDLSIVRAG